MRVASLCLGLAPVWFIAIAAAPASAAFIAYIANDPAVAGGDDVAVTDNGPGDNFPGSAIIGQINAGALNFSGFTIVTNVSQSKPLVGSAGQPHLSLTFTATSTDNLPHTIYLFASDTAFTGTGSYTLALGGTQSPTGPSNSVTGSAWGGTSNANLDFSHLITQDGATVSPFAVSSSGAFSSVVNPYSLTVGVAITRSTAGTTSGELDFNVVVPEPATASLIAGAAGLGLMRRRRRSPAA